MKLSPKTKNHLFVAGLTLGIFTITYTVLSLFGLVPKQFQTSDAPFAQSIFEVTGEVQDFVPDIQDTNLIPQKIEIPKINISSIIETPRSVDVATLDSALARGAVYYPGSGTLQKGNMFLFGHSTNWKVVNNQAYKTFNDLDKLVKGDQIQITSGGTVYQYKVVDVHRASENDVQVNFNKGDRMLTISTCDTFGRKQDRWVVEAIFDKII